MPDGYICHVVEEGMFSYNIVVQLAPMSKMHYQEIRIVELRSKDLSFSKICI